MRFPPSFLDEIRARIPVSEVVRQKVKLTKRGREWRGLSPFNAEKTPSFFVIDQKGFFHDFSSGKHGDAFTFLMETEGLTFPEAVERLAALAGLPIPQETEESRRAEAKRATLNEALEWAAQFFEAQLCGSSGARARAYLSEREIGEASRALFRIGYAPQERFALRDHLAAKGVALETMIEAGLLVHGEDIAVPYDRFRGRIMFPIHDRSARVIAFGGRALEKDVAAKYLNSPETPLFHKGATLYNLHNARKAAHERKGVIAVEGYIDVIAMTAAGFPQTVAPLGTALTAEQCGLLWSMAEEPVLCFDGDKAGRKAAYRAIDTALPLIGPGRSFRFAFLPEGQDPDELFRSSGPSAIASVVAGASPLAGALWLRETENQLFDTPERRAGLERRFAELAGSIQDDILRRHYARELSERAAAFFGRGNGDSRGRAGPWRERGRGRAPRFGASASPRLPGGPLMVGASLASSPLFRGAKARVSPREALILLILSNHPELLAVHLEEIAALQFESKEAEALRVALVQCAEREALSAEDLARAIVEAGLKDFQERLVGMAAHSTLWCVRAEAALADAGESLRQALVLHRRVRTLNRELRKLEAKLAACPTDHDSARLRDIQTQLSALDGTEAVIEGFGAMSGRSSGFL